jgi:hypothetical protein
MSQTLNEIRNLITVGRLALRRGDIAAASREAKVFELLPVSA